MLSGSCMVGLLADEFCSSPFAAFEKERKINHLCSCHVFVRIFSMITIKEESPCRIEIVTFAFAYE